MKTKYFQRKYLFFIIALTLLHRLPFDFLYPRLSSLLLSEDEICNGDLHLVYSFLIFYRFSIRLKFSKLGGHSWTNFIPWYWSHFILHMQSYGIEPLSKCIKMVLFFIYLNGSRCNSKTITFLSSMSFLATENTIPY